MILRERNVRDELADASREAGAILHERNARADLAGASQEAVHQPQMQVQQATRRQVNSYDDYAL